jgi:hypothetical protein
LQRGTFDAKTAALTVVGANAPALIIINKAWRWSGIPCRTKSLQR